MVVVPMEVAVVVFQVAMVVAEEVDSQQCIAAVGSPEVVLSAFNVRAQQLKEVVLLQEAYNGRALQETPAGLA